MAAANTKPWLTASEQIDRLKSRGVHFLLMSEDDARAYLEKNSIYFRLRAYRLGFPKVEKGNRKGEYANLDFYAETETSDTRAYEVEILRVNPRSRDGRDLLLRVTDPELLETTGGIVQGMSGSPILQDGRLVGAVTHVLVANPAEGYGIFLENMLTTAG